MNHNLHLVIGIVIIILANFGCNKEIESNKFVLPTIINTHLKQTSKRSFYADKYLSLSKPIFIGKFKFGQPVDVNPETLSKDTTYRKDFMANKYELEIGDDFDYNGFELIIDYAQNIFYRNPFDARAKFDSVYYCYYPVYFVNSTNTEKIFPLGSHLRAIQEVKKKTYYYAIEINDLNLRCGIGTGGLLVRPREYVVVLMKKYEGEREGIIRTRFKIGPTIYVSKPFLGNIYSTQFQIEDGSLLHKYYEDKEYWDRISYLIPGMVLQKQNLKN